jgi:predicted Zn-dependent protease
MAEASKGSGKPPEFLSTHPSEATRIKKIEGWLPEAMQYYRPNR